MTVYHSNAYALAANDRLSKSFDAAQSTLAGIELMHMLRKGQLEEGIEQGLTTAEQFSSLAA
jgi:putative transposase